MDVRDEYGTRAIQSELLSVLKDFHAFCMDHDIKYSLAYGSLLGAIRHKGFIPWDDDVDVVVTRENFTKLREVIVDSTLLKWEYFTKNSLWIGRISRVTQSTYTNYPPQIDIFILDNVPDNRLLAKIKLFLIRFIQGSVKHKPNLNRFKFIMKIFAYITWLLGRILSERFKWNLFERVSKWGDKHNTMKVCCYNTIFGYLNKTYSSNVTSDYNIIPFEDTQLLIMNGYDEFLTTTYGDYMTPPSKKVGHHIHPEYSHSYK